MTTVDVITALFCRVDEALGDLPKHPQAKLHASEVVTMALLFALKGGSERAFYRWLERDYRPLFPRLPERTRLFARLPERTRLFRLFATHQGWTDRFLAPPTVLGVADSYGVDLLPPYREQRRPLAGRLGRKGLSNHRWIVGGKLAVVLNKWGLVCGWAAATANVHDSAFQPRVAQFADAMIVLADANFAPGGQPAQPEGLSAQDLERPHAGGDDLLHAHPDLPCQAGRPSRLALRHDAPGLHHGAVQSADPMGRPPA